MGRITPGPRHGSRLPGVGGPETAGPRQSHHAGPEVTAARHRAAIRDLIDVAILLAVDVLFMAWESARLPLLSRDASLWVLVVLHAIVVVEWIRTRFYTPWRARRIAATWSAFERDRWRR